ncbi:MAG: pyrroline-5-carboxylate reductase [Planctomycetota bacterium]|jgi:pyrroline-5-carboxylate reductase
MAGGVLAGRRLGLIGAGKMAEAIVRGVVGAGVLPKDRIAASDPDPSRRELMATLGVRTSEGNGATLEASDIIVLAVKPQVIVPVLEGLGDGVTPEHLIVSIAAGIPTTLVESKLPEGTRVVRVMPNTPMQVGRGTAALARGSHTTLMDMEAARTLFATTGIAIEVAEDQMDAVTAVSGTGPAYAFLLAECMMEAGTAEGLSTELARLITAATIEGAGAFLASSSVAAEELRRSVTSPGGTTEAAFNRLGEGGVREHFVAAVRRAAERSRELGQSQDS